MSNETFTPIEEPRSEGLDRISLNGMPQGDIRFAKGRPHDGNFRPTESQAFSRIDDWSPERPKESKITKKPKNSPENS